MRFFFQFTFSDFRLIFVVGYLILLIFLFNSSTQQVLFISTPMSLSSFLNYLTV
jgi:Kef-type K+ transport system membrane component KefB